MVYYIVYVVASNKEEAERIHQNSYRLRSPVHVGGLYKRLGITQVGGGGNIQDSNIIT